MRIKLNTFMFKNHLSVLSDEHDKDRYFFKPNRIYALKRTVATDKSRVLIPKIALLFTVCLLELCNNYHLIIFIKQSIQD